MNKDITVQHSLKDTLIVTYIWLDDQLKALVAQAVHLPRREPLCLSQFSIHAFCTNPYS